ncbi:hypothetical protein Pcinc_038148 [Petrolisthes cinctipes]|uniref:Uncharacterized protein n=1 Tax=Petrolisthes cinctipes TaxID=88211 RepID=A0AAE1BR93_PETCI|nr:hypothetical protein Pcinc_038148 [Petrolisthes cinctipes]
MMSAQQVEVEKVRRKIAAYESEVVKVKDLMETMPLLMEVEREKIETVVEKKNDTSKEGRPGEASGHSADKRGHPGGEEAQQVIQQAKRTDLEAKTVSKRRWRRWTSAEDDADSVAQTGDDVYSHP